MEQEEGSPRVTATEMARFFEVYETRLHGCKPLAHWVAPTALTFRYPGPPPKGESDKEDPVERTARRYQQLYGCCGAEIPLGCEVRYATRFFILLKEEDEKPKIIAGSGHTVVCRACCPIEPGFNSCTSQHAVFDEILEQCWAVYVDVLVGGAAKDYERLWEQDFASPEWMREYLLNIEAANSTQLFDGIRLAAPACDALDCGLPPAPGAPDHMFCPLCRLAHYCGPGCQKRHWPQHKVACQWIYTQRGQEEAQGKLWMTDYLKSFSKA